MPTDSGPEVAECVWAPQWVSEEIGGLPVCEGLATDDDLARTKRTAAAGPRGGWRPAGWSASTSCR